MIGDDEQELVASPPLPHARLPSGPVGQLLASVGNLSNAFNVIHSLYAQDHDLGTRGIWTLSAISEGHASPGEIARLMMLPPSVVSGDLNRLLDTALIERRRDGSDGRRLVYSLTEAGRDVLSDAHGVYVDVLGDKMATYPPGEIERLLRVLYEISLHVRASIDEGQAGSITAPD